MINLIKKLIEFVFGKSLGAESVRYLIIGGMTTLVNVALFELLFGIIGIDVRISNIVSIVAAVLFAYVTNKLVVFRSRSDSLASLIIEFLKFVGSRLFTMALEFGAVELFHNVLEYDARLVKYTTLVLVIILNYLISKLIVFRKRD